MSTDIPTGLLFVEAPPVPETFNVLLFGRPKQGKSTAAATAPGPILWVNAEGAGALGYARKVARERDSDILEVRIDKETERPSDVLDQVYLHVRDQREPIVRTVVVDTLAKVRKQLIRQLVMKGAKNSLQQYGDVADKLGGFVNAMCALNVNVVLIAHVDTKEDPEGGRMVDPLIGGALTETIPGEVDVVAYVQSVEEDGGRHFYGQLVERKGRQGGDRSGGIADERGVRELDLAVWLDLYRKALTPDNSDLPFDVEPPAEGDEPVDLVDQQTLDEAA